MALLGGVLALAITGCAGSRVGSGFTIYGDSPVARTQLAERFHRTCRRLVTPVFARPQNEMIGHCDCASTALMNYGSDDQFNNLKVAWQRSGTGGEFQHLVVGMTQEFYQSYCGSAGDDDASKVALVTLRGLEPIESDDGDTSEMISDSEKQMEGAEASGQSIPRQTFSTALNASSPDSLRIDQDALKDPDLIKYIQRKLESLGHFPGPIDGIVGPQTRSALMQYRLEQNIDEGISDEEVMSTLIY